MKTPQTAEKTICPNCEQWQNNVKENASAGLYSDCFNDCAERGLSPKIQTCVIPVTPAQAPQTSHSPLPWKIDDNHPGLIRDSEHDTIVAENLYNKDAALIVRACNEYEQLKQQIAGSADWQKAAIRLKSALDLANSQRDEAKKHAQRLADNAARLANWMQRNVSTEDTEAMLYVVEAQKALAQWEGLK